MTLLILAIIVFILVAVLRAVLTPASREPSVPYRRKPYLLSKAERSFYGVLVQAVKSEWLIFSKVRVADVLAPQKGLTRVNWQKAFNRISAKHFDFILCDPQTSAILLAVELDDRSHGKKRTMKRDMFLDRACQAAGFPLLRIQAARGYAVADIRHQIESLIQGVSSESEEVPITACQEEKVIDENPMLSKTQASTGAPSCKKCGANMTLRRARNGKQAGQSFWGCSAFPKCREIKALDSELVR